MLTGELALKVAQLSLLTTVEMRDIACFAIGRYIEVRRAVVETYRLVLVDNVFPRRTIRLVNHADIVFPVLSRYRGLTDLSIQKTLVFRLYPLKERELDPPRLHMDRGRVRRPVSLLLFPAAVELRIACPVIEESPERLAQFMADVFQRLGIRFP